MRARRLYSSRKNEDDFAAETQLYIDPVACIDCGACVSVCPVSAIFPVGDLPEKWKHYAEINAKYYIGYLMKKYEE